jgi:hypothetical protein
MIIGATRARRTASHHDQRIGTAPLGAQHLPDHQQAIREPAVTLTAKPIKTLANGFGDRRGHGHAGEARQFSYEPIGFFVFDIEAHDVHQSTIGSDVALQ